MPGCDLETWGYRGEDGKLESGGLPRDYSVTYKTGDTIGCGVDYERQMFFTKNGKHLGNHFLPPINLRMLVILIDVCRNRIYKCFWSVISNRRYGIWWSYPRKLCRTIPV